MHDRYTPDQLSAAPTLLDAVPDCIQIADAHGIVLSLNAAARKHAQFGQHSLGDHWTTLWNPVQGIPEWHPGDTTLSFQARLNASDSNLWAVRVNTVDPSLNLGEAAILIAANRIETGIESFSRLQQTRLELALTCGKLGTWEIDLETGLMTCSAQCKANYGRPQHQEFTYNQLASAVHPEDLDRWQTTVQDAMITGEDFEIEYRNIWPDGRIHWAYVRASCSKDVGGKTVAMTGISQDITERKKVEEQLRWASDDRSRSDLHKSQFIATLGHELRNPLSPLLNGIALLKMSGADDTRRRSIIDMMDRQIGQLNHLIRDLLDIAQIERGEISLVLSDMDLRRAVEIAVESSMPLIGKRGHRLTVDFPPSPCATER